MFQIDKNVEIPEPNKARKMKYPLRLLEVGDSFFVPLPEGYTAYRLRNSVQGCIRELRPKKYAIRTVTESGVEGLRVWRIE